MASLGLIAKVVENLRNLQLQETFEPDQDAKKKEKIANCLALTNEISLTTVKASPQVLNLSIETLLCLCDDSDSDVRTVADECLNKIIRSIADGYVLKVQFELYREIKRNGAARCLRAALSRFGLLSHMIRPVKAKVFASQLTPCILEIAKRKEDIVIETLSQSLPLILKTLGIYIPDKDIQVLLKAFFQNVISKEAILRRASANMIITTCLNCRKPHQFINYVMEQSIDVLSYTASGNIEEEGKEVCASTVLGIFGCIRLVLPYVDANSKFTKDLNEDHVLDHHICIYELCLFYAKFYTNHNVINAALETLVQLLQNPPKNVVLALMSKDGITQRINKLRERGRQWPSKISLSMTILSEDNLESNLFESDFIDIPEIRPKVEKWMTGIPDALDVQKVSNKVDALESSQIIDTQVLENYSGLLIGSIENEEAEVESNASSDVGKFDKTVNTGPPSISNFRDEDIDDTTMSVVSTHEVSLDQFMMQRNDLAIGSLLDNDVSFKYCCRLLASSFLLSGTPGQLMPDKLCRVSVKSLALNCLGNILKFYPNMLFASLEKDTRKSENMENSQMISDVLMFHNHSDPQIRGIVTVVVGYFLRGMFANHKGSISKEFSQSSITLENLMNLILKGLEDESATTCRQTLTALNVFLPNLLESEESEYALVILNKLPYLVKNPYFLVKIKLAEILGELPYTTIEYVNSELQFQESIINVLLKLLSDQDPRVRKAASNALIKIIPSLYYEKPREDPVTRKASLYSDYYLSSIISQPNTNSYVDHKLLINNLVEPYDAIFQDDSRDSNSHDRIDEALSRVIGLLTDRLLVYSSKYLAYGCCETLSMLSEAYLTTVYPSAWDCLIGGKQNVKKPMKKISRGEAADSLPNFSSKPLPSLSSSLFSQTIVLLSSSPLSLDLSMHRHLLLLAGNLASGIACCNSRPKEQLEKNETEPVNDFKYWVFLKDKQTSKIMEKLLIHIMRVLNIFQHVVEDLPSPVQPVSKSSLPSLPSAQSLSPKRNLLSSKSKSSSSDRVLDQPRLSFKFGGKDQVGNIVGQPHYLRLYELLRAAHSNYRTTLNQEASELYFGLLNACLQTLSQILEVASITEASRIVKEILQYLQSTVLLSSVMTIQCVRQLLKSLSETNLLAKWAELWDVQIKWEKKDGVGPEEELKGEIHTDKGFYEQCFQKPAKLMSEKIKSMGSNCRGGNEPDTSHRLVNSLQRKEDRKVSSIFKILRPNSDQNTVSSFILIFEPLVIKSLIQYTTSNSIPLQCQVLMLLSELVQLHINYCLLDSDKIFISFVMNQFEFIEEGHILQTEELLPKIFDFLVRLSYEKYHSKLIIAVPKIIQLCDGLMASGQPPLTHCIPGLVPVVEEMFLAKAPKMNVNEEKELETTREVLMSTMLRLAEYPKIIELIAKCLIESRASSDGEEKWRRWSRQAIDTVLPLLTKRRIWLESKKSYFALVKLFSAVSPTVFRPVDPLLKVLFTTPPSMGNDLLGDFQRTTPLTNESTLELMRWIGTVNVMLLSLISYSKEEAMLARLTEVTSSIPDLSEILLIPDSSRPVSGDPLNVSGLLEPFIVPPEKILSRLLFIVINSVSSVIAELIQGINLKVLEDMHNCDKIKYLVQQMSLLLQLCVQMFESGSHCKVANASMQFIQGKIVEEQEKLLLNHLNDVLMTIGINFPILACQWTYLLTLLGYDDMNFWSKVVGKSSNRIENPPRESSKVSINSKIVQRASMILLCDYICENVSADSDRLAILLQNHLDTIISLADEPPVRELVLIAVHRDSVTSDMFLRAVSETCCTENLTKRPSFVKRLLQCLEGAHQLHSGRLLEILVPNFLKSKNLALSRMAAKIASRRIEMMLTQGNNEVLAQLSKEAFQGLMARLKREDVARKHSALVGLLNKLAISQFGLEPLELDNSKPFDPALVKNIKLDRKWYFSQVKTRCCQSYVSYGCFESAWLLSHLNLDECLEIFDSKEFNVRLLQECVIVGTRLTAQASQRSELDGTKDENLESILLTATKLNLIQRIRNLLKKLPQKSEVLDPSRAEISPKQNKYASDFKTIVFDESFQCDFFDIIPAITSYVLSLGKLHRKIESDHETGLVRFAVLCLEIGHLLVLQQNNRNGVVSPRELESTLKCCRVILREPSASKVFGASENYVLVCSATAALTKIVKYLFKCFKDDNLTECGGLKDAMEDESTSEFALACTRISSLVRWLEKWQKLEDISEFKDIPGFYEGPLKSLIISVARQPLVNSFVLTPPLLWKSGCTNVGTGPTKCQFALFSSEPNYVPELDVLEEFIFRISLLGWNSRQQFEEIWMVLLGVLNVTQLQNEVESDTTSALSQTASLAVQAITNLLMQTLILPCPGDPNNGSPIRHPRDLQLSLQKKSTRRLFEVQDLLLWNYENFFNNFSSTESEAPKLEHIFNRNNLEPQCTDIHNHAYGQLSVSYLWSLCSLHEDKLNSSTLALKKRRDEALAAASLDINSCLRFLLDLYASWMIPGSKIPLRLLHEVVKSLLLVSELFVERSQFQWMLESCMDLWKVHLVEDEVLRRHLIVAVCKASAVLTPMDTQTLDKVKRLIDSSLKHGSLSMRVATLHGILYLLQSAVLADCEETMCAVYPLAIDYIRRYIGVQDSTRTSSYSEEHQCVMWALVFFLLEHDENTPPDTEAPAVLELILSLVSSPIISTSLHRMLLQGLERLVATKSVIGKVSEQVVKISIERLRQTNPALSLPALQLFLTCMYTDTADKFNQPEAEEPLPDVEPEILVRSIERSSAIFDKIKKAYPVEVKLLCAVLSEVLIDFFPPMEILTKVIGEFLSPQQPHPRMMSAIVFKVCEKACNSTQLGLLQTWVVFSIQNFIQSLPLIMSTWCLSCFFISTSTNPWLRALFPHVQSRIGRYEYEDKKILCLAAADFYSQLTSEGQKEAFIKTFEDAAKNSGTPFADILACF